MSMNEQTEMEKKGQKKLWEGKRWNRLNNVVEDANE